jgi:hypothetical protein
MLGVNKFVGWKIRKFKLGRYIPNFAQVVVLSNFLKLSFCYVLIVYNITIGIEL